jgi:hypothetical protein
MLAWTMMGCSVGLVAGAAVLVTGALYYPLVLRISRPR